MRFITLVCSLCLFFAPSVWAEKVSFAQFCPELAGQWSGNAAKAGEAPKWVTVTGVCSGDLRQLMLTVSVGTKSPFSETWWFRDKGEQVQLTYFDGVSEDKQQLFSLYQQSGDYSLLGQGVVNGREALIQLLFQSADTQGAKNNVEKARIQPWQWLQNVQFLDDDVDGYRFFRGIEMTPVASPQ